MRGKRRAQALGAALGAPQVPHMAFGGVSTFKSFPFTASASRLREREREASAEAHLAVARAPAVLHRTTPPSHPA